MRFNFRVKTSLVLFVVAVVVLTFSNCKEETKTIKENGKDYFPLTVGSVFYYTVDSFLYDGINKRIDTASSYVRDYISEIITDSAGIDNYRIERSYQNDSDYWVPYIAYTSAIHPLSIQTKLNNSREVRMSFPITPFKTWDGNLYNTKIEEEYYYIDIQESFKVDSLTFGNTITVLQKEFFEPKPPLQPLFDIYRKEVFAKGVGMVYKIDRDLDLQDDSGHEIVYKLREYFIK